MTPDDTAFFVSQLKALATLGELNAINDLYYLVEAAKKARLSKIKDYDTDSRAYEDLSIEISLIQKILDWLDAEHEMVQIKYNKLEGK